MVEIRIVDILGYSSEDPKYPAKNLINGGKWLTARNFRGTMNEVTLKLEKCTVISAVDVGNCGTAILTVEVSRTGMKDFYTLVSANNLMTREQSMFGKNRTSVKFFRKDDMCEDVRNDMWNCVRVTCTQPYKFDPFGLSFVRIFSYEESPLAEPSPPSPPGMSSFIQRFKTIPKNDSLSRSERLLLQATGSHSPRNSPNAASSQLLSSPEAREGVKRRSDNLLNRDSSVISGVKKSKQSLFRTHETSDKHDPATTEDIDCLSRLSPNSKEQQYNVRVKHRKQHQKEKMPGGSKHVINKSLKGRQCARYNDPQTTHKKREFFMNPPEQVENLYSGSVSDSDDSAVNLPPSAEAADSRLPKNFLNASPEIREGIKKRSHVINKSLKERHCARYNDPQTTHKKREFFMNPPEQVENLYSGSESDSDDSAVNLPPSPETAGSRLPKNFLNASPEIREGIKKRSNNLLSGCSLKAISGVRESKQSLFRTHETSDEHGPATTEDIDCLSRLSPNPKEQQYNVQVKHRKQCQKEKMPPGGSLSKRVINKSLKGRHCAHSSDLGTTDGKPESFLNHPEDREVVYTRSVKDSGDSDADTVVNIPSSPDSLDSQVTLHFIHCSSDEGVAEGNSSPNATFCKVLDNGERRKETDDDERGASGSGIVKNRGGLSIKSNSFETSIAIQDVSPNLASRDKCFQKSNLKKHCREVDKVLPSCKPKSIVTSKRKLTEANQKKKQIANSFLHKEVDIIEISDSDSNESSDVQILVESSPEKENRKKGKLLSQTQKKSNIVWVDTGESGSVVESSAFKGTHTVRCPLCSNQFPTADIEEHAAFCEPEPEEAEPAPEEAEPEPEEAEPAHEEAEPAPEEAEPAPEEAEPAPEEAEPAPEEAPKQQADKEACPVCTCLIPKGLLRRHVPACMDALCTGQ